MATNEFKKVYERYIKFSKMTFKIAIVSFVVSFILIVVNTGNAMIDLIARIGMVIFISSLFESYFLKLIARIYKNKNKIN